MSTVARRVASTPARTAAQTWAKITELLAPDAASAARRELNNAAGVACAAIASEATKDAPIVMWGVGPRVRVYCVFADDALSGDGVYEDALTSCPTDGDWKLSIPCAAEDVAWSNKKLASASARISARASTDDVMTEKAAAAGRSFAINAEEFLKS
jgi:hypothetical protein